MENCNKFCVSLSCVEPNEPSSREHDGTPQKSSQGVMAARQLAAPTLGNSRATATLQERSCECCEVPGSPVNRNLAGHEV